MSEAQDKTRVLIVDDSASVRQTLTSIINAAPPEKANALYEEFNSALRALGVTVATGIFQAMMSVELVNEGPVTILLDSDKTF